MDKSFEVAGHTFRFTLPQGHPLCEELGQYAPFEVGPAAEPLFDIEVVDALQDRTLPKVYGGDEEPGQPVIYLYRDQSGWAFEMAPSPGRPFSGRALVDNDFTHAELKILREADALFALNNAAMLMFAFRTAGLGTLEVHASVIVNDGRAFLWMAKSGTGKSTHSRLWLKHIPGSHLLNDDNPVVRVLDDGTVEAFGTPWSGKTPCYINRHFPVGAFVEIKRSPVNRITRKNNFEAYALLYSSSSGFKTDRAMADGLHSTLEKVALGVPCYTLECRPDSEAAEVCSKTLLPR